MKSEKFIIQPGKVCTYDPININGQDDVIGFNRVLVSAIKPKSLFKPRMIVCTPIDQDGYITDVQIVVPEYMLKPDGFMIVRNPVNAPIVNNVDIATLDIFIKAMNDSNVTLTKNHLQRLEALREKLNFYVQSTEV